MARTAKASSASPWSRTSSAFARRPATSGDSSPRWGSTPRQRKRTGPASPVHFGPFPNPNGLAFAGLGAAWHAIGLTGQRGQPGACILLVLHAHAAAGIRPWPERLGPAVGRHLARLRHARRL